MALSLLRKACWISVASILAATSVGSLAACGGAAESEGDVAPTKPKDKKDKSKDDDGSETPAPNGEPKPGTPPENTPPAAPLIYSHTQDTLYTFDAVGKKLAEVGKLKCLEEEDRLLDVAIDGKGAMFGTTDRAFIAINPKDATCTIIIHAEMGSFPNSLSFVPAGSLDPAKDALVGYAFDGTRAVDYVRIDTTDGTITKVGNLNPTGATKQYRSSGDIFSVAKDGNRSYLTVRPDPDTAAADMLAEIDPKTGAIKNIIGNTFQRNVFGLAYWNDKAYGFSDDGNVREISVTNGTSSVITTLTKDDIPVAWFGAGMTTEAPVVK